MKQLSELKILIIKEIGGSGYIFFIVLIADFQGLKDIFGGSAFGGEVLDVSIDGDDGSNDGSGRHGRRGSFSVSDQLEVIVSLWFSLCPKELVF